MVASSKAQGETLNLAGIVGVKPAKCHKGNKRATLVATL